MIVSKSMRLTLLDVYMAAICAFPIATSVFDTELLNKALFGMILALQIAQLVMNPMKKGSFLGIFILAGNFLFAVFGTQFPMDNANMLFYFPFFLLYTYFMCDNQKIVMDWFRQRQKFVRAVLMIWTLAVGVSIFLPSAYRAKEGGHLYFGSFCGSIFRLGPSAMFVQVLSIVSMVLYKKRKDILFQFVPLYCGYMGSSRTYLAVIVLVFVVAWYIFCTQRRTFWATIIPLAVVVIWLIGKTAIGDKIDAIMDEDRYGDFWFRVTSSRSKIWDDIFKDWATQPFLKKLIGVDMNYSLNLTTLWAHNDFVEILCSFGIVGLIHYLYAVIHMLRAGYGRARVPVVLSICVFMAWLVNAFFNMHYVYFCAMLCLPFLVFILREYSLEKRGERGSKYLTVQYDKKIEG